MSFNSNHKKGTHRHERSAIIYISQTFADDGVCEREGMQLVDNQERHAYDRCDEITNAKREYKTAVIAGWKPEIIIVYIM